MPDILRGPGCSNPACDCRPTTGEQVSLDLYGRRQGAILAELAAAGPALQSSVWL